MVSDCPVISSHFLFVGPLSWFAYPSPLGQSFSAYNSSRNGRKPSTPRLVSVSMKICGIGVVPGLVLYRDWCCTGIGVVLTKVAVAAFEKSVGSSSTVTRTSINHCR
eukprot:GHVN01007588.1.p1 GENE.GHVN01007588.1~~GHVN01007588.1.p1  ORF type:complete len:107 (+),score=7.89 GHVN01007588.1:657-977(+)